MTQTTDTTDESDETNSATLKRREVIGTLAAAGVLGSTAIAQTDSDGGGSVGVGGGPMSDELAHINVRWYSDAESELPDPGVEGRYFRVEDADVGSWDEGDILEDTGDSWQKISGGFQSLRAEQTESKTFGGSVSSSLSTGVGNASDIGGVANRGYFRGIYKSMSHNPQDKHWGYTTKVYTNHIWQTRPNGGWTYIAEVDNTAGSPVYLAAEDRGGWWYCIQGGVGSNADWSLRVYSGDPSDSTNVVSDLSMDTIATPRPYSGFTTVDGSNSRMFIMAEYNDNSKRIIKSTTSATNVVLDASGDGVRHLHSVDQDPFDHSRFIATAGDAASEQLWYESTDSGDTWSQISGTRSPSSQIYTTLNVSFVEVDGTEYIYWVTDYEHDNGDGEHWTRLYRAPSSDPAAYEEVAKISKRIRLYGTCVSFEPYGLIFGGKNTLAEDADSPDVESKATTKLWFWSLESERLFELAEIPTERQERDGVRNMPRYVDMNSKQAHIPMIGSPLRFGQATGMLDVELSRLH